MVRPIQERHAVLELWRAGGRGKGIARASGVPRSTVRCWLRQFAGVAQAAEAADLKSAQWGFESLHQHHNPVYVYLLGLYLGDGCITRTPRTYVLRIFLNENQPHVIAEAARAIIISIARRPDVARLDAIMGHSWSDPSEPATTPA